MADPAIKSALLVMDVQPGIVERLDHQEEYLNELKKTVAAAHQKHLPVIYVVVGFRPGFPEVSQNNKSFSTIKDSVPRTMINPQPVIEPTADDFIVIKRRVSAFSGSDLEVLLRGLGVQRLILSGIATSGVVLSTLREAADKDFQLSVLSDLCADFDQPTHNLLLEKVFPRQATVLTAQQWAEQ